MPTLSILLRVMSSRVVLSGRVWRNLEAGHVGQNHVASWSSRPKNRIPSRATSSAGDPELLPMFSDTFVTYVAGCSAEAAALAPLGKQQEQDGDEDEQQPEEDRAPEVAKRPACAPPFPGGRRSGRGAYDHGA